MNIYQQKVESLHWQERIKIVGIFFEGERMEFNVMPDGLEAPGTF